MNKRFSFSARKSFGTGAASPRLGNVIVVALLLLFCLPLPAFAYGDPTGGALFQILGPILALAWGAWMIFANGIRRRVSNLFHKVRGTKAPDTES